MSAELEQGDRGALHPLTPLERTVVAEDSHGHAYIEVLHAHGEPALYSLDQLKNDLYYAQALTAEERRDLVGFFDPDDFDMAEEGLDVTEQR